MAALKVTFIAVLASIVVITAYDITDFNMEETCGQIGGQCIMKDECPHEIETKNLGLCPKQRSQGAECCNGVSTKEYRCHRFGGECFAKSHSCPDRLIATKATDCGTDERCCILV